MWISILPSTFESRSYHCTHADFEERRHPLVVCLHGGTGSGSLFRTALDIGTTIGQEVILIFPTATENGSGDTTWNSNNPAPTFNNTDDVTYLSNLINNLITTGKVDTNNIWIIGHSNGAMMGYRLIIELPTVFKGLIAFAGDVMVTPNTNLFTGKILHVHGELDTNVPLAGGVGLNGYTYPAVEAAVRGFTNASSIKFITLPTGGHEMVSLRTALINDLGTTNQALIADFILG